MGFVEAVKEFLEKQAMERKAEIEKTEKINKQKSQLRNHIIKAMSELHEAGIKTNFNKIVSLPEDMVEISILIEDNNVLLHKEEIYKKIEDSPEMDLGYYIRDQIRRKLILDSDLPF
ncbi:hypothetical protein [Paenibacillus taichungensis]|uniref:hypothetical protein n=1 Tax=Paenibacillus taichungensis TaxID=484184 RepID=UPI0028729130|nr:hypothetical protein [Paenibacillus taichungensis]MDR9748824.1 hypothetical protein [Paenibacillus taichungensis]